MSGWMALGCRHCRAGILSGSSDLPQPVCTNVEAHAHLRHCPFCGAWWQEGEREAHVIDEAEARRVFSNGFESGKPAPSRLPPTLLDLLDVVLGAGGEIEAVARWSAALVVHMQRPLNPKVRDRLRTDFSSLRFFRDDGSPHDAPSEGFIDDRSATAISFPV